MSDLLRDALEASLEETDAECVARLAQAADARPLALEPGLDAGIIVAWRDLRRLTALALEALERRHAAPPPQVGAKGRLIRLVDTDGQARLTATIEFESEDDLRRAGPMIASAVVIEPLIELSAANESGEGSPHNGVSASARTAATESSDA
jgi:hypothetical protein